MDNPTATKTTPINQRPGTEAINTELVQETVQSTYIGGDLGEAAKSALIRMVNATHAHNKLECLRQICLQIEREMVKKNLTSFTFGDIQILPRD